LKNYKNIKINFLLFFIFFLEINGNVFKILRTMKKNCVIGLGNKGIDFDFTRHNFGKDFINWFSNYSSISLLKKDNYYYFEKIYNNSSVNFIIPDTYMNESGIIIKNIENKFDKLEDLIILHDDLDVNFEKIVLRDKEGRGLRGHNGLRSIIENLKKSKKFKNEIELKKLPIFLSLGIGRPSDKTLISDFVLQKFNFSEKQKLEKIFFNIINILEKLI